MDNNMSSPTAALMTSDTASTEPATDMAAPAADPTMTIKESVVEATSNESVDAATIERGADDNNSSTTNGHEGVTATADTDDAADSTAEDAAAASTADDTTAAHEEVANTADAVTQDSSSTSADTTAATNTSDTSAAASTEQSTTPTTTSDEANEAPDAPTATETATSVDNDTATPPATADVVMEVDIEPPAPPSDATVKCESPRANTNKNDDTTTTVQVPPAVSTSPSATATPTKRKATESPTAAAASATKKQHTATDDDSSTIQPPAIKTDAVATDASPPLAVAAKAATAAAANASPTTATPLAPPLMLSRDDMAKLEEDSGLVKFDVITNDGTPDHFIQLTTLKNIFAKQLPKMPKEYIVRLVFDRNHRSMVILKNGTHVIGGICYRPFLPNGFAEIAFCAINAADQVKGYGTRLMNHLKEFVKRDQITHFLTYADNYAIGYFKKQGFAKVVSMPRPNWFGYIKDYDGGTLMECSIHSSIDYLQITNMVHKQRKAIQDKIHERSRAHVVYDGLTKFADGRLMDIYMIPGVKEAGWSPATIRNSRIGTRDPGSLKTQLTQLWKAVSSHRSAWPFHEPVDTTIVVDYLEYIKEPVDLTLIAKRIESGQYISKAALRVDFERMCDNCMVYNTPDTNYYKAAKDLQEFIQRRIPTSNNNSNNATAAAATSGGKM